jgi:beta-phosphoglucomutase-like phosphatase (HAD superfamily)
MIGLKTIIQNFPSQRFPTQKFTSSIHPNKNDLLTSDQFIRSDKTCFTGAVNKFPLPEAPAKVKLVLLDADGTLFNTVKLQYLAWKKLANHLIDITKNNCYTLTLEEKIQTHGYNRRKMLEHILEKGDVDFTDKEKKELESLKAKFTDEALEQISVEEILMPGAVEFLNNLKDKGIKFVMVTNGKGVESILEKTGLQKYFNKKNPLLPTLIDGNDRGKLFEKLKPHPDCYIAAAEIHGVSPSKCKVLEDSPEGFKAASEAGIDYIAIGKNIDTETYSPFYGAKDFEIINKHFDEIFEPATA